MYVSCRDKLTLCVLGTFSKTQLFLHLCLATQDAKSGGGKANMISQDGI